MVKNLPAVWEIWVWSLGWEDPLEKGKITQLQYSGPENSMDRGTWQAIVHGGHKELDTAEWFSLSLYFMRWPGTISGAGSKIVQKIDKVSGFLELLLCNRVGVGDKDRFLVSMPEK